MVCVLSLNRPILVHKMLVKIVFLVFLQTALATVLDKPSYDTDNSETMAQHFEEFIKTYDRQYTNDEKALRFNIFIENVKKINDLNKRFNGTIYDINNFADMSKEEQSSFFGLLRPADSEGVGSCAVLTATSTKDSPAALDWREKGAVSPAKSQSSCGACWAFATAGLLESRYLQRGQTVVLSEQQLLDCDKQSNGCNGGLAVLGLSSIIQKGGLESENDYPYENTDQNGCRFDQNKVAAKVTSCTSYSLETGEDALQDLLAKEGPLAIAVYAENWKPYHGSILRDCAAPKLDHAVLLVGYGTENGEDYWIIKNSWGSSWGENGFIRMKKGVNCCGIASTQPYDIVSAVVA